MDREKLLEKLELVKPALAKNDLVPVLRHFWFKNDALTAYNDQIAIQTKLVSNFAGAIPDTLVALVKASRAKEVEFSEVVKGQLVIKAASGKFKLPFLPDEATKIFDMPDPDPKQALPVDMNEFLEAIESCMLSLKEDPSMPDSLGITLIFEDIAKISLYATNDATISHASVGLKKDINTKNRVVLSGNFCRQMLSIAKLEGKKYIELADDYSMFVCGDTSLFGRLVDVSKPLGFEDVIQSSFPKEGRNNLVSIPTKLELMLDRACVIGDKTSIVVEGGIAKFLSKSDKGEVRDSVQLESNHPDVSININPRLFRNGYGNFDKMLLTETCLVMSKGTNLYLVSASV
jgi:DNA polymerase III sliding clamp (beta) subunit (PCNA family)